MAKRNKVALDSVWDFDQQEIVEDTLPNGTEVRLTVGWFSAYAHAFYEALVRETFQYAKDEYGLDPVELIEAEAKEGVSAQAYKYQSLWQRCWMLAGLRKVEVKPVGGVWTVDDLPARWRNINTFVDAVPKGLYESWRDAVMRLNPQLFTVAQDDDAKKNEPTTSPASTAE